MTPARTPEELDALVERLGLIAAWHKPGGPTPKHPMPSRTKTCTQAAATITDLRARIAARHETYDAAVAVIEADREAVRAEQAAEIERLTLTVRKLQGHQAALESYLREIRDKPVARSSDAWKRHCLKLQAIAAEALGDVA